MSVVEAMPTGRDCQARRQGKAHAWMKRCAATLFTLILYVACAAAQEQLDQVHVNSPTLSLSQGSGRPVFRSTAALVLVNVAVVDRDGRAITGLQAGDFRLLDDNAPQQLKYFWTEDEPLSLMIVLDASASMAAKLDLARDAVRDLVNASFPNDDISLVVVSDTPRIASHLNDPPNEVEEDLARLQPEGFTSLWDGMYLGMKELATSHTMRRAMIVVSDGGDNHSRYTEQELKSLVRESDVDVYAIGMFDRFPGRLEERRGPLQLDEVTSATGGRLLSVHDPSEVARAASQIDRELRTRYILGYSPRARGKKGEWHKLQIRLNELHDGARYRLHARKRYFVPAE